MTEPVSKRRLILDSVLAHCVTRAMVLADGDFDSVQERFDAGEFKPTAWSAVKVTPKAMRVATFIVFWATAMREEGRDGYSITEYQRRWDEGERAAYRVQKEFRELWPEFETPNEIARQLVTQLEAKKPTKRDIAVLPMTLQVEA